MHVRCTNVLKSNVTKKIWILKSHTSLVGVLFIFCCCCCPNEMKFVRFLSLENLIRGLDDDEVNFLDIVDKAKMDAEKRQQIEENNELLEFRQRVASLQEKSIDQVQPNIS